MPDKVSLNAFPNSKISALAMLYLQNQDLSSLTPEAILEKYNEAYDKINKCEKTVRSEHRKSHPLY